MFSRNRPATSSSPTVYPAGLFIKTERGLFYIANAEKRFFLISSRVLDSWSPQRVIETSEAAVGKYRIAAKIKFRNGSLIHNIADGKIYLVEEGKRRHITDPDVLTRLGATRKDVVSVSLNEIMLHDVGKDLS